VPSSRTRPDGAPQVLPYLYYPDARSAVEFLTAAFGFTEVTAVRDGNGTVWHADLSTGDGIVMVGPGMAEFGTAPITEPEPASARTFVYVDDVDDHCRRARQAGARILAEPGEQGPNRVYCVADCGGHQWIFGTPLPAPR
jgi:uncharacterized glyoxalase superfamily protein PhnB